MRFTPDQANAIYDVLVEECGAPLDDDSRVMFGVYLAGGGAFPFEFRFQGDLGFGGKFRATADACRWRVDCYPEDRTPERDEMVRRANARLAELEAAASA